MVAMPDVTPPDPRRLRVFLASPDDVGAEREIVERVVRRLDYEYGQTLHLDLIRWEHVPLPASADYQTSIPPPSQADVVLVAVWNKLGRPLSVETHPGPLSGGPVTGTEWEFEDALKAARERGRPELLVYRRRARITADPSDVGAMRAQTERIARVETFMARWFDPGADKAATAAHYPYAEPADFEKLCAAHLRALVTRRLEQLRAQAAESGEPAAGTWEGSPFPGLASFELEQAPVFFGRARARRELRDLLARRAGSGNAFVLVLGASGSGKSSLVKAGLLADLKAGHIPPVTLCRHAVARPSDRAPGHEDEPLSGLAAALGRDDALPELALDTPALLAALRDAPDTLTAPLAAAGQAAARAAGLTDPRAVRLALVVDQF